MLGLKQSNEFDGEKQSGLALLGVGLGPRMLIQVPLTLKRRGVGFVNHLE